MGITHRKIIAVIFALMLVYLSGCSTAGRSQSVFVQVTPTPGCFPEQATSIRVAASGLVEVDSPTDSAVTISRGDGRQPNPPKGSAETFADATGAGGSSGDAAKIAVGIGGFSLWVGLALIVAGMLLFLSKRAGMASLVAPGPTSYLMRIAALAPKGTGIGLMVLGGAVIVLPWFLDQWDGYIVPVCLGIAGLFVLKYIYNLRRVNKLDEENKLNQSEATTAVMIKKD